MEIFQKVLDLFQSPRFVSFYWQTGALALVGIIALLTEAIPDLGFPEIVTTLVVFALNQATKAINNRKLGKEMGFVK